MKILFTDLTLEQLRLETGLSKGSTIILPGFVTITPISVFPIRAVVREVSV